MEYLYVIILWENFIKKKDWIVKVENMWIVKKYSIMLIFFIVIFFVCICILSGGV